MDKSYLAVININRAKSELFSSRAIKIFIDGQNVGKIYKGEQESIVVETGIHSIYIKAGKATSNILTVDLRVGQIVNLDCGIDMPDIEEINGWKDIKTLFASIKQAIYLRQVSCSDLTFETKLFEQRRSNFRIYLKRILFFLSLFLCILGLIGFSNGFLTAGGLAFWVKPNSELPLGYLNGVAVDSKGQIYCVSDFYYRIQKYDANGMFLKGWPSRDNNPRIRINEHDQLESADDNATRSGNFPDSLSTYDSEGNLISEQVVDGCFAKFGKECERRCRSVSGDIYSIHSKLFWPHIIKMTISGTKQKVITTRWYLWLIMGPFPAWIFFAVGLISFWKIVERI